MEMDDLLVNIVVSVLGLLAILQNWGTPLTLLTVVCVLLWNIWHTHQVFDDERDRVAATALLSFVVGFYLLVFYVGSDEIRRVMTQSVLMGPD